MEIKTRYDINELIIFIEQNFNVNDWKLEGVHLWPYMRFVLYEACLININSNNMKSNIELCVDLNKDKFYQKMKLKLYRIVKRSASFSVLNKIGNDKKLLSWFNTIPKKDYLFISHHYSRVEYEGFSFNKYFDTFIREQNIDNKYLMLELVKKKSSDYFNEKNIMFYHNYLDNFIQNNKIRKIQIARRSELTGLSELINFLKDLEIAKNFNLQFGSNYIYDKLIYIKKCFDFFTILLNYCKPKVIIFNYYRAKEGFFLNAMANRLNIETIDYQHGCQVKSNLSYSDWTTIPAEGYDFLPKKFWHWDEFSAREIRKSIAGHKLYKSEVVGNFWVNHLIKSENLLSTNEKGFILYCLQPYPVKLKELFSPNIIKLIEISTIPWYIRLHPGQIHDMAKIINLLKLEKIYNQVVIERATNTYLPILLANCLCVVTQFSSVAVEANLLNKKTIFFHKSLHFDFIDYIQNGKAFYLDPDSANFLEDFQGLVHSKLLNLK